MPVATADFIAGMRRLAAGVTIVTANQGELRAGLTATSVCSLTAKPPRLLACVHRDADAHDMILDSGRPSEPASVEIPASRGSAPEAPLKLVPAES